MTDKRFFDCFCYAVYDFVETKTGFQKYASLYGKNLWEKVSESAREPILVEKYENGHNTKNFLQECLSGKYDYFIRNELRQFLMPFLWDAVKLKKQINDTPNYYRDS